MPSYLQRVSQWCADNVGIGVGEPAIRAWFVQGFNQDAGGRWLTIANGKLIVSAREMPLSPVHTFCEMASAEGTAPVVRLLGLEFTAEILPGNGSKVMETVSIAWRTLEAAVVEDGARSARLRYEYTTHTGAAATRLDKSPDIAQLIQGAGLTTAEYEAAVTDMVQKATTAAFAKVFLRQIGFPDYRPYMSGIQIGASVALSTIGAKVWIKGAPRIDASDLIGSRAQQFRLADEALSGLGTRPANPGAGREPADAEAERKGMNVFVPGPALVAAISARLPAKLPRLRNTPTGLAPTQGMTDLVLERKSLKFQSNYGVSGADPYEWTMTFQYTGAGTMHASQFELCSENSPAESTVDVDTGLVTMRQYVEKLGTGTPILYYKVRAQNLVININPHTNPIRNNGTDGELANCILEAFKTTAAASNLPWLDVDRLPFHNPAGDELTLVPAPNGIVLSKGG